MTTKYIISKNGNAINLDPNSSGTSELSFTKLSHTSTFDDLACDLTRSRVGATAPTFEALFSTGLYVYNMSSNNSELHLSFQLPHSWKEGTIIYPHLHFIPVLSNPAVDGTLQFEMEYMICGINTEATTSTVSQQFPLGITTNQNNKHLIYPFTSIDLSGYPISTVIPFKIKKIASTGISKVYVLSFDAHIEIDSFGSSTEFAK